MIVIDRAKYKIVALVLYRVVGTIDPRPVPIEEKRIDPNCPQ
jgi:hypothetical protein